MSALLYSEKCISCHKTVDHNTLNTKEKALVSQNCIDCHMPVKESHNIGFQISNSKEKVPYRVRTHRIGIYEALVKNGK
jgi:nitrate/TMAO reductase-like tetraheme cytochrome c subunit